MSDKTKTIIYWLFVICILCPVVVFIGLCIARFGVYLEQYIGEVPSNFVVVLITFVCGYGLKVLSGFDKS